MSKNFVLAIKNQKYHNNAENIDATYLELVCSFQNIYVKFLPFIYPIARLCWLTIRKRHV